jgi:hypothetical protein
VVLGDMWTGTLNKLANKLLHDYFTPNPVYSEIQFFGRCRMIRPLFLKIVEALSG